MLTTTRADGSPQASPVSVGVDAHGRFVVASSPQRAMSANPRRRPAGSAVFLSGGWNGAWVQVDGTYEVLDLPDAVEPLVDSFRAVAGEHPDRDEHHLADS